MVKPMSKSAILRGLRIQKRADQHRPELYYFYVEIGEGETYRSFGLSLSEKGAKELRATIRKQPAMWGIV